MLQSESRIPSNGGTLTISTQDPHPPPDYPLPHLHISKVPVGLGPCWYAHGTRGSSAGSGNVPMRSVLRSPALRHKHLRGWMMSWVPFPKMSLLPPPVFTPHVNPLHKSLCQRPMPWTSRTSSYSCSKAHKHQEQLTGLLKLLVISSPPLFAVVKTQKTHNEIRGLEMRAGTAGTWLPTAPLLISSWEQTRSQNTPLSRRRRWGGQRPSATDI